MKRIVHSLLLFFCTTLFILSATVCVCVPVHADAGSYAILDGCTKLYNILYGVGDYYWNTDSEVRYTQFYNSSGNYFYSAAVSLSSFRYSTANGNISSCPGAGTVSNSTNINGVTYYYLVQNWDIARKGEMYFYSDINPYINNNDNFLETAVYYTFGEGAIDPVEPVTWGLIDLEGYQTNVAGQGNASINNVDVISWNDTFDTNSNDISAGNVRVRYVPGYYRATSKQNLLAQTYQDFVLDIISAVNGDVYPVSDGSASFRWGDVIGSLSIPFYSIYNLTNSTEGWLKRGWIYEVRLEIDDYIGEWQTVYSSTSSGVENDMTIVNTTVVTQDVITAIQNINSINDTTNIWIIYGQPVDPNPEITPPADDDEKPWWVYLLEMINNTLGIQNEYINEGTDESIEIVNNFEEDHNDLNVTVNDYDDIENNIVNDMNDNLDDLDIESDLIENNSFLSSARWVAEQYTRITTDNPIGSILKFSLVLGFVMIFLGRFK